MKGLADCLVDLFLQGGQAFGQLDREGREEFPVEGDPRHLHVRQDGDQRHLDGREQLQKLREAFQFLLQDRLQAQGIFSIRGGVWSCIGNGDLRH